MDSWLTRQISEYRAPCTRLGAVLVARWVSDIAWYELYENGGVYSYECNTGAGKLGYMSREEAIAWIDDQICREAQGVRRVL